MGEDKRRHLRDSLDEIDRYFEELEKEFEDVVRKGLNLESGQPGSFVAGFSMRVGPGEKPTIQFFGDSPTRAGGFRSPLTEQLVNEKDGTLRLVIDLPGVQKEDIEVSATGERAVVKAERKDRKYMTEVRLKREIDPEGGKAEYRNGVLEISFSLKDKDNKGYRRVDVD